MLETYRRVLSLPGALAFSLSGLLGRLPISMISLGIVLLVSERTGSYSLAGSVSAAYIVANATVAVLQGRLTDRFGQTRVLPIGALGNSLALGLLMWSVETDQAPLITHAAAFAAGATIPVVGAAVRARWVLLVPEKRTLQTAFAYEAVMDEVVFMVGPTLVTVLATAVHPLAGLGAAIGAGIVGTLLLAAQRGTAPPPQPRDRDRSARPRMPWRVLVPMVAGSAAMGAIFGSVEVATVAFTGELGRKELSGALLATWALGSLLSGIATGAIHWKATTAVRFRWGMVALAVSVLPLPFLGSLGAMAGVLFVAGFAISPTLIALMGLTEQVVPPSRLTEGMSIVHTGMAAGIAPGAAAAGQVIDRVGPGASYWVPVAAGVLGVAAAFIAAATAPGPEAPPSPTGSPASPASRPS
ncbi:MFS transporter [Nocardioides iriomotensis]|uniref:MFS transporter n=1 Tax=Nocardioides iriomotensis TaxID=715784 RepID=A0A4V1Z1S9_9ACTN|nr:MFS transporter [Nocardioides iriomotensis]RYU11966.1 MFS transporter [Nocardioides iriomotensis]